jgi:3-oxoacyl-[acyl-carrier-protein] synthase II
MGEIAGWGLTNDAHHMTAPSRDGSGLALAVHKALQSADISEDAVACVAAHGTGTVYNDSMEMKAFKEVFGTRTVPTYSVKGGTGHTMGAAGLIEIILAFRSLREKVVPPTVNVCDIDDEAQGWISSEPCVFDGSVTVSTNSGFGGINCAVLLEKYDFK